MSLEPRLEERDVILLHELDDFSEVLFFIKGAIDIGFELNRKKYYVLRKKKHFIIGDHGCVFNHKSNYIYKTHLPCEGFSIRKNDWKNLLKDYDEIAQQLRLKILQEYFFKIQIKVNKEKNLLKRKISHRSDIQ